MSYSLVAALQVTAFSNMFYRENKQPIGEAETEVEFAKS